MQTSNSIPVNIPSTLVSKCVNVLGRDVAEDKNNFLYNSKINGNPNFLTPGWELSVDRPMFWYKVFKSRP